MRRLTKISETRMPQTDQQKFCCMLFLFLDVIAVTGLINTSRDIIEDILNLLFELQPHRMPSLHCKKEKAIDLIGDRFDISGWGESTCLGVSVYSNS